ncbi:uncharacterized protein [Magallana gigas]|uniref:uncharacterized protein isoform X6 n=1 Tax=Magallana gigas TaxID=29159 RepID=UPI00334284D8
MSPLLLCSVFILMLTCTFTWAGQNFVSVADCPKDANGWELRSKEKSCYGDTPDYLCAAIENKEGEFGEICTKYGLTPSNKCAVLNAQTHNLDSVECKAASGCPSQPYIPSELWRYKICYGNFYEMKTTLTQNITPRTTNAGSRNGTLVGDRPIGGDSVFGAGLAVAVVFIVIIVVVVVVLVVFYVTNKFGFRKKVQQLYTDLRQRFQHSGRTDSHEESEKDAEKDEIEVLLHNDDTKKGASFDDLNNGANSDQPIYAKPEKTKTRKDPVKPEKAKTKKGKHDDRDQKKKKLEELLKYLVHILERELSVNDLKEKMVIHSKSIEQYFSEPLIKELQSVEKQGDYSRLDISSVFTLLWNFCDGIKPPSRGWDYEPSDDETHVGADIERIRFMWNKYCDDDFEFKHLDEVYNRMKQKYGTVAVLGDDGVSKSPLEDQEKAEGFETVKLKIQSNKLNEDCSVEKGIVITEGTTSALKIMDSKNVVILKGAIGCGKTHALMAIQNHFKEKQWETEWVEFQHLKEKTSKEKPTILLCDNLFGRFGSCVFSQNDVDEIEEILKTIETSKDYIKTVIGVHTHIFDEVKKDLKLSFLQQKNITVEMDKLSAAETLLIYKEQHKRGHCKMDPTCWFKKVGFESVLDKLSKNQGHIGSPFLSLMYCKQHELFSDPTFPDNPVKTLMQHFQKIRQEAPTLYKCLVYLMCVQEHNFEKEPKEWARQIGAEIAKETQKNALTQIDGDITKENLQKNALTSGYVHVETNRATLAHDILTMVLFKSTAEADIFFTPVVLNCSDDIIIQLLRPAGSIYSDFYCEFEDVNKESPYYKSRKVCVYRLVCKFKENEKNHPLMTKEFVRHKYEKYMTQTPKYKEH